MISRIVIPAVLMAATAAYPSASTMPAIQTLAPESLSLATIVRDTVVDGVVPCAFTGQAMARIETIAATIASSRTDLASIIDVPFLRNYAR